MTSSPATPIGLTAIVMWSLLAASTVATGPRAAVPAAGDDLCGRRLHRPADLAGGRRGALRAWRQPALVWLVGVGGLFGYHALYFLALRLAPPARPGLLNYLGRC